MYKTKTIICTMTVYFNSVEHFDGFSMLIWHDNGDLSDYDEPFFFFLVRPMDGWWHHCQWNERIFIYSMGSEMRETNKYFYSMEF